MNRLKMTFVVFCGITVLGCGALEAAPRHKKEKKTATSSGPTAQLYNTLNNSYGGKLNTYLLADIYSDPSNPSQQYQRVIHVIYNKDLYFGRFTIHVRSVGKLNSQQLAIYNPEAIFKFGNSDSQEFEKINPGAFGETGDLFLEARNGEPLAEAPVTDEVRQEYEMLVTKYILPAVQKQASGKE
ncbi:MAG: hypothetical protein ACRD2B_16170 [Terriglobia bacterium]